MYMSWQLGVKMYSHAILRFCIIRYYTFGFFLLLFLCIVVLSYCALGFGIFAKPVQIDEEPGYDTTVGARFLVMYV